MKALTLSRHLSDYNTTHFRGKRISIQLTVKDLMELCDENPFVLSNKNLAQTFMGHDIKVGNTNAICIHIY